MVYISCSGEAVFPGAFLAAAITARTLPIRPPQHLSMYFFFFFAILTPPDKETEKTPKMYRLYALYEDVRKRSTMAP